MEDIKSLTERPPVVRFVNEILADAIKLKASDIHIEPQKTSAIIRYRVDGFLRDVMQVDRHVHAPAVSRIKVISRMDISVRRKPQDGRCRIKHGKDHYDLRVSTIPTSYGEKVTLRILNPESARISPRDRATKAGLGGMRSPERLGRLSMRGLPCREKGRPRRAVRGPHARPRPVGDRRHQAARASRGCGPAA